jgi:hypothetical protein
MEGFHYRGPEPASKARIAQKNTSCLYRAGEFKSRGNFMPLIEAALAFAITMLALSLIVSSLVELIHRAFKMREAGLKYMLGQMFDQVLKKYIVPGLIAKVEQENPIIAQAAKDQRVQELWASARTGFVERMSANRVPMGVAPKATPTDPIEQVAEKSKPQLGLWGGRDLATMNPTEFMERLGSIDLGEAVKQANATANAAGAVAAGAADAVLKDIAQKFEAFGKEAGVYFEGRARLLSVLVAVVLAFAVHVDAIDLFKTYLRDPNARAKVIEQSQAVTAQYKAAQDAAEAVKKLAPDNPDAPVTSPDVKAQMEKLKKDWEAAIAGANATVKQYADIGVPLGWNDDRLQAAKMKPLVWTCKELLAGETESSLTLVDRCRRNDADYKGPEGLQYKNVYVGVPRNPGALFYLLLGGLLIGLGSPFWYNAVTALTNLRSGVSKATGSASQAQAPVAPVAAGAAVAPPASADKPQPVTPVGAFQVSHIAR